MQKMRSSNLFSLHHDGDFQEFKVRGTKRACKAKRYHIMVDRKKFPKLHTEPSARLTDGSKTNLTSNSRITSYRIGSTITKEPQEEFLQHLFYWLTNPFTL